VYVCICVYVCVYVCIRECACMCVYMYTYAHVVSALKQTFPQNRISRCKRLLSHLCLCVCVCACVYVTETDCHTHLYAYCTQKLTDNLISRYRRLPSHRYVWYTGLIHRHAYMTIYNYTQNVHIFINMYIQGE